MLRELRIKNLALIEELTIAFNEGLVVLTGETGAGKSIILQAIHLLSGGRAATGWIRAGAESATVEALFELAPNQVQLREQLRDMGLDGDDSLIIRRVLADTNKSRFFINGSMSTAKVAGEIAENLLSVASQHDHQLLLQPRNHLDFIDSIGGHWRERQNLAALHESYHHLKMEFEELRQQEKDKEQRRDFLTFQLREIMDAALRPGEDQELALDKERLKASGDLLRLGQASHDLLSESIGDNLAMVRKNLEQMAGYDENLVRLHEDVAGLSYQLEDHVAQLRSYIESIPTDPGLLDAVTERIDQIQKLKRKYGATIEEILEFGESASRELNDLEVMDQRLAIIEKDLGAAAQNLLDAATNLSAARRQTALDLSSRIMKELHSLCFERASFEVHFPNADPGLDDINRTGWDRPEFLFSANPGEPLKPLAAVASGGELSRVMLALKCILAGKDMVDTVIFDEIDAGISGKTAEAVARKIKELAGHHQVLCITHLPQIASSAGEHFRVSKSVSDQRTRTSIMRLSKDDQVLELARMLDGDSVTDQTLAYVRELLARKS